MFLSEVDLTLSGLGAPSVRLWLDRDEVGVIVGSTGYEISRDGHHALIRSVAVSPTQRSRGRGSALATFALERAVEEGASRAWLFSRRPGPFWQSLGFEAADRDKLTKAPAGAHPGPVVSADRAAGSRSRVVASSRLGLISARAAIAGGVWLVAGAIADRRVEGKLAAKEDAFIQLIVESLDLHVDPLRTEAAKTRPCLKDCRQSGSDRFASFTPGTRLI